MYCRWITMLFVLCFQASKYWFCFLSKCQAFEDLLLRNASQKLAEVVIFPLSEFAAISSSRCWLNLRSYCIWPCPSDRSALVLWMACGPRTTCTWAPPDINLINVLGFTSHDLHSTALQACAIYKSVCTPLCGNSLTRRAINVHLLVNVCSYLCQLCVFC